jgi:hypothetical protein
MRWTFFATFLAFGLAAAAGLLGCGGSQPGAGSGGGGDDGEAAVETAGDNFKTYALSDLPEIDKERPIPLKDEGRVQFWLPTGWKPLKPNQKFLIACIPEDNSASQLPRITIAVSTPTVDDKSSTTSSNAQALADKLQAQMEADKKRPLESCKPLQMGDQVWVRHVRKAAASDGPVAIQSLQTIKSGRLYSVELTVTAKDNPRSSQKPIFYEKELQASRNFAYAVAANMKFPKDASGGAPTGEENPAENPAEEKPAEEKPAEKSE